MELYAGGGTNTFEIVGKPSQARIECGFAPRIIMVFDSSYGGSNKIALYYNKDVSTTQFQQQYNGSASSLNLASDRQLYNVDSTGFNMPFYSNFSTGACVVASE